MVQKTMILVGLLLLGGLAACYSPTLPLPPPARDGLVVSAPDADGYVLIEGEPGVFEPGQQAVIINMMSRYGWIVPIEDDGWLRAEVTAEGGDVLSIQRRAGYEQSPAIEILVPEP